MSNGGARPQASALRTLPKGRQAMDMAQAGMRGLARMGDHWGLTVEEQRILLGGLPKTTYYAMLKGQAHTVSRDTLERLSLLLGIWANLEILLPSPQSSVGWMRRPHADLRFEGHSPLAWMLQGTVTALVDVRRYLEAWRFGL
jgi:hypothetical protein